MSIIVEHCMLYDLCVPNQNMHTHINVIHYTATSIIIIPLSFCSIYLFFKALIKYKITTIITNGKNKYG